MRKHSREKKGEGLRARSPLVDIKRLVFGLNAEIKSALYREKSEKDRKGNEGGGKGDLGLRPRERRSRTEC